MWAGTTSMTAKNHEGRAWGRAKKTVQALNEALAVCAGMKGGDFLPCGCGWVSQAYSSLFRL